VWCHETQQKHIPYFAALVQTAQYSWQATFDRCHGLVFVGIMGALISWRWHMAQVNLPILHGSQEILLIAMIFIMSFSPILIGTATWIHLTIIPNPYWRGVVSAAWGLLPDLAVALAGFIAGKGLVEQGAGKPQKKRAGRLAKGKSRSAKPSKARANISCRYAPQCDRKFASQNAANAHARTCGFKPTVAMLQEQNVTSN
jgi:hypothetical protein